MIKKYEISKKERETRYRGPFEIPSMYGEISNEQNRQMPCDDEVKEWKKTDMGGSEQLGIVTAR